MQITIHRGERYWLRSGEQVECLRNTILDTDRGSLFVHVNGTGPGVLVLASEVSGPVWAVTHTQTGATTMNTQQIAERHITMSKERAVKTIKAAQISLQLLGVTAIDGSGDAAAESLLWLVAKLVDGTVSIGPTSTAKA